MEPTTTATKANVRVGANWYLMVILGLSVCHDAMQHRVHCVNLSCLACGGLMLCLHPNIHMTLVLSWVNV